MLTCVKGYSLFTMMIEFTLTTLPHPENSNNSFTVGIKLHPGAGTVSETEMTSLKNYLTPTALGVLSKLLEVDGRLPQQGPQ